MPVDAGQPATAGSLAGVDITAMLADTQRIGAASPTQPGAGEATESSPPSLGESVAPPASQPQGDGPSQKLAEANERVNSLQARVDQFAAGDPSGPRADPNALGRLLDALAQARVDQRKALVDILTEAMEAEPGAAERGGAEQEERVRQEREELIERSKSNYRQDYHPDRALRDERALQNQWMEHPTPGG